MSNAPTNAGPRRLLFLAPKLGLGGMTRYMVELAEAMAAPGGAGCAVRVATVPGPGIERFRDRLEAAGAAVHVMPALTRRSLRRQLREHRTDAIKLFTGAFPPDTRLSLRLAGSRIPIVESIHVLPTRRGVRPSQHLFYRLRSKPRYAAVVFTEEVAREFRSRIPELAPRVHRLRYGMALPAHGLNPHNESEYRFVTVCRLDEGQKDVETLLRAFAIVREEWDRTGPRRPRLSVVGDGPDRQKLSKLAADLVLRNRVTFTGWLDDPVSKLRESDVFVLSTRRESPGRVNIEAAAVGLAVIASRVEGCTESVADTENGLLVEPGDPRALADAMLRIATDTPLRTRLASRGPTHAANYAMPAHAARVLQLCHHVCGRT